MAVTDDYVRSGVPAGELALAGPSARPDGRTLPVRGDLAHIRLAGLHFVPHYAVPMPHRAGPDGAVVRLADADDAEALAALDAGAAFDVLDMAGGWAWGEVPGGKGPVGYVLLSGLEAVQS